MSGCEEMWRLCCDPINHMCCGLFLIPLDKFVGSALRCGQILDFESSAKPNNSYTMAEELLWPLWPCLHHASASSPGHTKPANCGVSPCPMPHEMALRPLARSCHQTKIIKLNERNGLVFTHSINHSEVKFKWKQQIRNRVKPDGNTFSLN